MSDFARRLVDRTVRPVSTEPTIAPRGRGRFESFGAGTPFVNAGGIEELHLEVPARPAPSSPSSARPSQSRQDPVSTAPWPTSEVPLRAEVPERRSPSMRIDDSETLPAEPTTTVTPPPPLLDPVVPPTKVPRVEPEDDSVRSRRLDLDTAQSDTTHTTSTTESAPLEVAEQEGEPILQPVVEVQRTPGPVIVIERPRTTEGEKPQRGRLHRPAAPTVRSAHERPVAYEGGDPLERLGLDRLDSVEVIATPAMQDALDREDATAPIHVHIGRLEVQRPGVPPRQRQPRSPPAPVLSLDDYLAERATHRGAL